MIALHHHYAFRIDPKFAQQRQQRQSVPIRIRLTVHDHVANSNACATGALIALPDRGRESAGGSGRIGRIKYRANYRYSCSSGVQYLVNVLMRYASDGEPRK